MADASTNPNKGWKFNQIGIRVSDLQKSLAFYRDVLGMVELSSIPSEFAKVVFIGYPEGGGADMVFKREGVLELMEITRKDPVKLVTNTSHNLGFGLVKITFTVPDMDQAVAHLKKNNVTLTKEPGLENCVGLDNLARDFGVSPDKSINKELWEAVSPVTFAEDPDGYLIEVIKQ